MQRYCSCRRFIDLVSLITGGEFANVAGRAGRAFVDVEGLIVHVMFDAWIGASGEWRQLVDSSKQSARCKVASSRSSPRYLGRLSRERHPPARTDAWEYLANSRDAWKSDAEEAATATVWGDPGAGDGGDDKGGDEEEDRLSMRSR